MYCTWDANMMGGIFCLLWFFFSNFILLNMFSAIILENFALTHMEKVQLQVMVYLNEKRKRFQKEELRKQMLAVEAQQEMEEKKKDGSWFRGDQGKERFVPEWEGPNEDRERKIMEEWELLQYSGLDASEQQQYLEIVRLERDEAETLGLTEEGEKLAEKSEAYEESMSGSSNVSAQIAKAAKADQAAGP